MSDRRGIKTIPSMSDRRGISWCQSRAEKLKHHIQKVSTNSVILPRYRGYPYQTHTYKAVQVTGSCALPQYALPAGLRSGWEWAAHGWAINKNHSQYKAEGRYKRTKQPMQQPCSLIPTLQQLAFMHLHGQVNPSLAQNCTQADIYCTYTLLRIVSDTRHYLWLVPLFRSLYKYMIYLGETDRK